MLKIILIALVWVALSALNAVPADTLITPQETIPEAGKAIMQFSTLMNWFILALLIISVISIIRMIIVKKEPLTERINPIPIPIYAIRKARKILLLRNRLSHCL